MTYYAILGGYSGKIIGVATDIEDVLEEEPNASFVEISKEEFEEWSDLDSVPLEKVKARIIYYPVKQVAYTLVNGGVVK